MADTELVRLLARQLEAHATVRFWDQDQKAGEPVWEEIFGWIDQSDVIIAVITDNSVRRAMSVGHEIGYAKKQEITVIPIVTDNVQNTDLGCLKGVSYVTLKRDNPGLAFETIEKRIKELKDINLRNNLLGLLGIVALIWLAAKAK